MRGEVVNRVVFVVLTLDSLPVIYSEIILASSQPNKSILAIFMQLLYTYSRRMEEQQGGKKSRKQKMSNMFCFVKPVNETTN